MLFWILAVVLAAASVGRGLAASGGDTLSPLFDAHDCRSCHKIGGRGGNSGPDLTLVGFRRPRAWIEKWLASPRAFKHDTKMPEPGLPAFNQAALVDFLSAQKGQAWSGGKPWDRVRTTDKGKMIYVRAGCVACHGPAGRGGHPNPGAHGDIIPALAPLMATYTSGELKATIRRGVVPEVHTRNHIDGSPAEVSMPGWDGVLNDGELDALAEYLMSLANNAPKDDW